MRHIYGFMSQKTVFIETIYFDNSSLDLFYGNQVIMDTFDTVHKTDMSNNIVTRGWHDPHFRVIVP